MSKNFIVCIFKNGVLCEMNEILDVDNSKIANEFIIFVKSLDVEAEKIKPDNLSDIDNIILDSIFQMKKYINKYMEQNADRVFIKKLELLNEMTNEIKKLKAFKKAIEEI
jgi:hypothetical protein